MAHSSSMKPTSAGLRFEEFEGPRYKRIDQIRQLLQSGRLDSSLRWIGREEHVTATEVSMQ